MPLHDALYIEYPVNDIGRVDLFADCMREAFIYYFEDKKGAGIIRLDANIWGPDYEDGEAVTPGGIHCKKQKIYIDERSVSEYEKFKKFMGEG